MKSNDQGVNKILNNLKEPFDNSILSKAMYDVFVEKNILKKKSWLNKANINIYSATKFCGDLIKQVLSSNDDQAKQHIYDIFNNCIKIICSVKTGSAVYPSDNDAIRNADSKNEQPGEASLNYVISFHIWFLNNFASEDINATTLQTTYKKIGLEYDDFVDCVQCIFRNLLVAVIDNINQCSVNDNDEQLKHIKGILKGTVELFCNAIVDIRLKNLVAKPNYKQGLEYKDICIVLDTINKCFPKEPKQNNGEEVAQQQNVREKLMQYFFDLFDLVTDFAIYRKDGFGNTMDKIAAIAKLIPVGTLLGTGYNFLTGNLKLTKEDILPDEVVDKMKTKQTKNENKSDAGNVLFDIKNNIDDLEFKWEDFIDDIFLADHKPNNSLPEENLNNCLEALYNNENEFLFDLSSWLKKLDGHLFWLIEYFLKLGTNAMAAKFSGDFSLKKVNRLNPADELFVPDENLVNDPKKKGDIVTQNLCMNENLRKIYFAFETQMLNKRFGQDSLKKLMIRRLSEKFGSTFNVLTELQRLIQDREKYPNKLFAVISFVLENFPPKKILEYIMQDDTRKRKVWHIKIYIVCGFAIAKMISSDINNQKSELTRCFKKFALEFVGDADFEKILINQDISNKKNIRDELKEFINNIYELPLKDCWSVFLLGHPNENKDSDGAYITKVVNRLKQLNEKSITSKEKLEALKKIKSENQDNNNEYPEKVKDGNEKKGSNDDDKFKKAENSTVNKRKVVSEVEVKREIREKSEPLDQIANEFPIGQRSPSTSSDTNNNEEQLDGGLPHMVLALENNTNDHDNVNINTKKDVVEKEKLVQDEKSNQGNYINDVDQGEEKNNLEQYNPDEKKKIGIMEEEIENTETDSTIETELINTSSTNELKKEELFQKEQTKCRIRIVSLGILTLAGFIVLAGIGLTILWMALITVITSISMPLLQWLIVVSEVFLGVGLVGSAVYAEYKFIEHISNIWRNLVSEKSSLDENIFTNMKEHSELSISDKIKQVQKNNSGQHQDSDSIDKIKMEKKGKDEI